MPLSKEFLSHVSETDLTASQINTKLGKPCSCARYQNKLKKLNALAEQRASANISADEFKSRVNKVLE